MLPLLVYVVVVWLQKKKSRQIIFQYTRICVKVIVWAKKYKGLPKQFSETFQGTE